MVESNKTINNITEADLSVHLAVMDVKAAQENKEHNKCIQQGTD